MTKYADDITCSIPVGHNVNDSASEGRGEFDET